MTIIKNLQSFFDKKQKRGHTWEMGGTPEVVKFDPDKLPADALSPNIRNADPILIPTTVKTTRRLVVIECPWNPEDTSAANNQNRYADYCVQDSLRNGESPYLGYPQLNKILNSRISYERDIAFLSHVSWIPVADALAVYIDHGITPSMQMSINVARVKHKRIEYRTIGKM